MFVFYVINVLLVTILTDTLLKTIVTYLEDPSGLLAALGSSLPSVSSFFINYVMLLGLLGPCIRLLGIERIILAELTLRFFARTPREIHSLTKCIQFSPGVLLAEHSLVATIGLVYGVVAPVVLFFVAFYFGVWYLVYSHLFRKSYIVAHCNGGLILADATKNLFIGIFLHQVMMIAFFFSSKAILPGCLILILLFLTIIIQHISRQYGGIIEQLPLQTIASKLPPDAEQISTISTTSPQKRKSVVVGLKDETAPSTTTTATVAATNDDCVSVLSVNSVNVNLESTPGTLKIVAAHATYSGGRKKLTPTLESSLAPCSPSTRLELWIPSDRYSLLETFILPGLAPYDFTIRTDGASMDEHGRMTIESNTG